MSENLNTNQEADLETAEIWEKEYQVLSSVWDQIAAVEATLWRESFEAINRHYIELRQKGLWVSGPTNFLSVLGRTRLELDHSNILAWLLDPCMRHGLGTSFLKRFLNVFGPDLELSDEQLALIEIRREAPVKGGGRIDLLLTGPGFKVVLENKVDSPEGKDQCHHYYRSFAGPPGVHFVFLTPDGREPESAHEEEKAHWVRLSYRDIASLLREALRETSDIPVSSARQVAEGYLVSLQEVFDGQDY